MYTFNKCNFMSRISQSILYTPCPRSVYVLFSYVLHLCLFNGLLTKSRPRDARVIVENKVAPLFPDMV